MPRTIPEIVHNEIIYDAYVTDDDVLIIRKHFRASGTEREVSFDNLPTVVKEKIMEELKK